MIDELIYRSYAYNRQRDPEIPVEDWTIIFGAVVYDYERRLQEEL